LPTRRDLRAIDASCTNILTFIEECDEQTFEASIVQPFTTTLSCGTEVELKEGGADLLVTFDTRLEYVDLVTACRLQEQRQQINALRRGIAKVSS